MPAIDTPSQIVQLMLTCASWQQAQRIVDHLLGKRLIAKAEFIPAQKDGVGSIGLVMESLEHHLEHIKDELTALAEREVSALQVLAIGESSAAGTAAAAGDVN